MCGRVEWHPYEMLYYQLIRFMNYSNKYSRVDVFSIEFRTYTIPSRHSLSANRNKALNIHSCCLVGRYFNRACVRSLVHTISQTLIQRWSSCFSVIKQFCLQECNCVYLTMMPISPISNFLSCSQTHILTFLGHSGHFLSNSQNAHRW